MELKVELCDADVGRIFFARHPHFSNYGDGPEFEGWEPTGLHIARIVGAANSFGYNTVNSIIRCCTLDDQYTYDIKQYRIHRLFDSDEHGLEIASLIDRAEAVLGILGFDLINRSFRELSNSIVVGDDDRARQMVEEQEALLNSTKDHIETHHARMMLLLGEPEDHEYYS